MGEYILWVVGAFLLYLVVLPLAGAFLGFVFIALLPYLAGVGLAWCLVYLLGFGVTSAWLWIFASIWAVTVFAARKRLIARGSELRWHEGHYEAARVALMVKRLAIR